VAYVAEKGGKWLVVVDGQEGAEYDGILEGGLLFSPDGQRVAYRAQKGEKWLVVVDGQAGAEYDVIGKGSLVFGPEGDLEYLAVRGVSLYRVKHVPVP
jgi:hypothetical protein